jgi:hypothetical protein
MHGVAFAEFLVRFTACKQISHIECKSEKRKQRHLCALPRLLWNQIMTVHSFSCAAGLPEPSTGAEQPPACTPDGRLVCHNGWWHERQMAGLPLQLGYEQLVPGWLAQGQLLMPRG